MNKIFSIKIMILLAVILAFGSCSDDKGNYDYTELTTMQIDTVNKGIKPEMTALQFENFKVPVEIKYEGDAANLSYEWKIYPQVPTKEEGVSKYDSAVVLFTKAVFDTIIYDFPGKYYLTLTVTDKARDIKEYLTLKLSVETSLSRGLCVLDEKNGKYDLHLIKTAKLLSGISDSDENIYYNVFTGANDREVTDGKFLGMFPNYCSQCKKESTFYFFTETGGFALDPNTYAIRSDDYKSWFSFPIIIAAAPSAYMVTSRPVEIIIDNGLVYKWDHKTMGVVTFSDRLDGDYIAAPYLPRISTTTFSTVIFDTKNKRFAPINQFGANVGSFTDSPEAEFNLNNIGASKELKFMDNGFNSYTYAIFHDTAEQNYYLYVTDFSNKEATPIKKYSMSACPGLTADSRYTFGNRGNVCFYSSGSDLYQYKYASGNNSSVVHSFAGETITGLEVFILSGHAQDGKLLIVSTVTAGGEGKVYLIGFNELNGTLDMAGTNHPYGGFGKVVDVLYKE